MDADDEYSQLLESYTIDYEPVIETHADLLATVPFKIILKLFVSQ